MLLFVVFPPPIFFCSNHNHHHYDYDYDHHHLVSVRLVVGHFFFLENIMSLFVRSVYPNLVIHKGGGFILSKKKIDYIDFVVCHVRFDCSNPFIIIIIMGQSFFFDNQAVNIQKYVFLLLLKLTIII